MEWGNLRKFMCPHCGFSLRKEAQEITCSHCTFHIAEEKFKNIAKNRDQVAATVKIRWQNLIDARCPICSEMLTPNHEGNLNFQKCINYDCTFRITDSRLGEILNDKTHAANIFYKENQTHEQFKTA